MTGLPDVLSWFTIGPFTDGLAWLVIGLFAAGVLFDVAGDRDRARQVTVAAWTVFGGFWLIMVPNLAFGEDSLVQGLLSLVAVPACLYTGLVLYRGRDSLLVLSRAVAVMGLIYLPFSTIEFLKQPLIEHTAGQVERSLLLLGYDPIVVEGTSLGYENAFIFPETERYLTEVVLACTGLGSMTIFTGLIAAIDAPTRRKLLGLAIVIPVIYGLNIVRVTFITLAHGLQWFADQTWVLMLFATDDPNRASFLLADRVLSQSLSVVALVVIALALLRVLPELVTIFDDVLYLLTGDEFDLAEEFGVGVEPADGPDVPADD